MAGANEEGGIGEDETRLSMWLVGTELSGNRFVGTRFASLEARTGWTFGVPITADNILFVSEFLRDKQIN